MKKQGQGQENPRNLFSTTNQPPTLHPQCTKPQETGAKNGPKSTQRAREI